MIWGEETSTGDLASNFLPLWGNILALSHCTHQQLWIFFQHRVTTKALGNWQLLGLLFYFPIYIYFVISIRFFFLTCTYYHTYYYTCYCCPLLWAGISHNRSSLACMAYEIIAMETIWITKSNGVKEKTYFRGLWICARACKFDCLRCKVYGIFWNGQYFINSHYCKVLIFLLSDFLTSPHKTKLCK